MNHQVNDLLRYLERVLYEESMAAWTADCKVLLLAVNESSV